MKQRKTTPRARYMRLAYQVMHTYSKKFRKEKGIRTWGDAIRYSMSYMAQIKF